MRPVLRPLAIAAVLLAALGPPAPSAEPNPLCGVELPLERLDGDYILSIGGGVLPAEGRIVPVGVADTFGVSIEAQDDRLVMRVGPDEIVFEAAGDAEPDQQFAAGIATADMSRQDFEAAVGCEIENLPRLVGRDFRGDAGAPVGPVYQLIVHAPGAMVGTLAPAEGSGAIRVVHLDRRN